MNLPSKEVLKKMAEVYGCNEPLAGVMKLLYDWIDWGSYARDSGPFVSDTAVIYMSLSLSGVERYNLRAENLSDLDGPVIFTCGALMNHLARATEPTGTDPGSADPWEPFSASFGQDVEHLVDRLGRGDDCFLLPQGQCLRLPSGLLGRYDGDLYGDLILIGLTYLPFSNCMTADPGKIASFRETWEQHREAACKPKVAVDLARRVIDFHLKSL
jgi:hypothetical protein